MLHLFVLPFVPQQKHYLQIIFCVLLIYSSLCTTTKTLSTNYTLCYTYLFFPLNYNKNIIYKLYSVLHLFVLPFVPQQKHYLQIIVCVTLICSSLCTTTKTLSANYTLCYTYLFFSLYHNKNIIYKLYSVLHLFILHFVPQQKHYLQIILCVTLIYSSLCATTKTLSTNYTLCYTYLFFILYHNKNIIYKLYSVLHLFVLPFVPQQKHYLQIILCVTLIYSSLCTTTKTLSTNYTLCYTYLFFPLYHNKNIIYKLYSVLHLFILHFVTQQKHYLQIIFCVTLICSSLCTTTKTLSTNYILCYTYLFFTLYHNKNIIYKLYSVLHLFVLHFVPQQKHYLQIIFCVTLICSSLCTTTKTLSTNYILCYTYLFFPLYHNKNIIYKLYSVLHLFVLHFVPQQKHYLQIIFCVTLICSSLCNTSKTLSTNYILCYTYLFFTLYHNKNIIYKLYSVLHLFVLHFVTQQKHYLQIILCVTLIFILHFHNKNIIYKLNSAFHLFVILFVTQNKHCQQIIFCVTLICSSLCNTTKTLSTNYTLCFTYFFFSL